MAETTAIPGSFRDRLETVEEAPAPAPAIHVVQADEVIAVTGDMVLRSQTQRDFTFDMTNAPAGTRIQYITWSNDTITFTNGTIDSGDEFGNTITITVGANMVAVNMFVYDDSHNTAIVSTMAGAGSVVVTNV